MNNWRDRGDRVARDLQTACRFRDVRAIDISLFSDSTGRALFTRIRIKQMVGSMRMKKYRDARCGSSAFSTNAQFARKTHIYHMIYAWRFVNEIEPRDENHIAHVWSNVVSQRRYRLAINIARRRARISARVSGILVCFMVHWASIKP